MCVSQAMLEKLVWISGIMLLGAKHGAPVKLEVAIWLQLHFATASQLQHLHALEVHSSINHAYARTELMQPSA